jgi:hypothetical protein
VTMRRHAALVVVALALLIPAGAWGQAETDVSRRTLGGHTFMYPTSIDSAFPATFFGTRTSGRSETISDLPVGDRTVDIQSLGVREQIDFELLLGEQFSAGAVLLGQAIFGTTGRALASQGAVYAYGAILNGAWRVLRIESSGTQVALRAQLFGVQGGGHITLVNFIRAIRNEPLRSVPDILSSFGDLVVTPESSYGGAASINIAQALNATFSLQVSFRLDLRHFKRSPFVLGQGRVDQTTTDWIPQGGVALGVNPPQWPVAFAAEYRAAAQGSGDPSSLAHHVVGVAGYYSARNDLQVGPAVFGEFGLPEIQGIDANGNPAGSDRGKAISGQLMMRYFW